MNTTQLLAKRILLVFMLSTIALLYWQMRPDTTRHANHSSNRDGSPDSLFEGVNVHFQSAGRCDHCHGHDPAGIASVSGELGDINVVDAWSSTMMANSTRDPLWRAKVSHEVYMFPQLQVELESTCTRCHAPMGRFNAHMEGIENYSIADMLADDVAMDGVSCLACHQQMPAGDPVLHSGQLSFTTDNTVFGPYLSPLISPMAEYTGLEPVHSSHISESALCAGCHSLTTETVDHDGNIIDNLFVEQATWHEWVNSSYPAQNQSCQSCHMPKNEGPDVHLVAGYNTEARPDFALHTFAGGNSLMLGILRDNREQLGIYASEAQFNKTIASTYDMLQNQSLLIDVQEIVRTADTLYVDVKLTNLSGHKLPSGNPSRRMSVHFVLTDELRNEIFRSGGFDDDYYTVGENDWIPHHNIIKNESQVQMYEMVIGDLDGNKTTILTKGYNALKDNRLAPLGFTTSHFEYDTTKIVLGFNDVDFNHDPTEGSGTDIIHYHIPLNGYAGVANANVKVWFQTVPPAWMDEMFAVSTPEIEAFKTMYFAGDRSPVLMKSSSLTIGDFVGVNSYNKGLQINIYQRVGGELMVSTTQKVQIQCYDLKGRLIEEASFDKGNNLWNLSKATGTYLMNITDNNGNRKVQKIVLK